MAAQINLLDEIIVDNFAGGGGASTGIELATGRPVTIAVNHDPDAILMHQTNHPYTQHYQASVWDINPVEVCAGRPVGLAWFSPDCKHFSKAKGGKPVDKNIRGLAWIVLRWAGTAYYLADIGLRMLMPRELYSANGFPSDYIIDRDYTGKAYGKAKPERMYFAYDTPDDYEPLIDAGRMLMQAGITPRSHVMSCYNLIGYKGDTFDKAEQRLRQTIAAGFMPYAMLYRDQDGQVDKEWEKFQREWLRPALVSHEFGRVWHR